MKFRDRTEAGRRLAAALSVYKSERPVVLALPRGGVPVAAEVAAALDSPLDLILVRKIGVPFQPELAMGAVVDGASPLVVRNEDVIGAVRVTDEQFAAVEERELDEIRRRRTSYLGGRAHPALKGRVVIVIDDGVATGATTRAALRAVRAHEPARLVLAVPVAPPSTVGELSQEADEIVCLQQPEPFFAIGVYYADFGQVSDDAVQASLARFPPEPSDADTD